MITQEAISVPIIPHHKLNPKSVDEFLDIFEGLLSLDLESGMKLDFTIDSKLGSDKISPTLYLAKPKEASEIANICKEVYEGSYPYKEIEDPQEVRKMIESPEHQQLFYEFDFRARGYVPCWNFKKEDKSFEDYVVFNYFEGEVPRPELLPAGQNLVDMLSL